MTSTCFEGVDLYDEEGKIFVVSDDKRQHTLIDIATSLPQISGRIRNTKYKGKITHLYSTTAGPIVSYNEYKSSVILEQRKAQDAIDSLNSLNDYVKSGIKVNLQFVSKDQTGEFYIDKNKITQELYNYKIKSFLYSSRGSVTQETQLYGFIVKQFSSIVEIDRAFKPMYKAPVTDLSLKDAIKVLDKPGYKRSMLSTLKLSIFEQYPFLENAIEQLGFQGLKECNYRKSEIEKRLIVFSNEDNYNKIIKLLSKNKKISPGQFVSSGDLKDEFSKIYTRLQLNINPTAAEIKKFFNAKETTRKEGVKSIKGYLLASKKIVSN